MFRELRLELENKPFLTDKGEIIRNLSELLIKAVKTDGKVGIAFSGGVDSSLIALIASKLKMDFRLYSVGLEGSKDIEKASELAIKMGWPLRIKKYTKDEALELIKKVVNILKTDDPVKVGVGCVVYGVLELAKQDGIKTVLGGLGAEEIFAGYERHIRYGKDYEHVQEELWAGLNGLEERDLSRDDAIADYFGIKLKAPFLDDSLVRYAMQIDPKLKINKDEKKIILMETAVFLGLDKEYAFRKKMAAQYGSKFDRIIFRLAHKKGFKLKREFLRSLINSN